MSMRPPSAHWPPARAQTVFFHLSGVLPMERAIELLKKSITKAYSRKGPEVVAKNHAAVDAAIGGLKKVEIPAAWSEIQTKAVHPHPAAKVRRRAWRAPPR